MILYVALTIGFLIRLLKADRLDSFLVQFGIGPVPKAFLPWLSLALGIGGALVDGADAGIPWRELGPVAFEGLLAGALAIAGQETVVTGIANVSPRLGALLGKKPKEPVHVGSPS